MYVGQMPLVSKGTEIQMLVDQFNGDKQWRANVVSSSGREVRFLLLF